MAQSHAEMTQSNPRIQDPVEWNQSQDFMRTLDPIKKTQDNV